MRTILLEHRNLMQRRLGMRRSSSVSARLRGRCLTTEHGRSPTDGGSCKRFAPRSSERCGGSAARALLRRCHERSTLRPRQKRARARRTPLLQRTRRVCSVRASRRRPAGLAARVAARGACSRVRAAAANLARAACARSSRRRPLRIRDGPLSTARRTRQLSGGCATRRWRERSFSFALRASSRRSRRTRSSRPQRSRCALFIVHCHTTTRPSRWQPRGQHTTTQRMMFFFAHARAPYCLRLELVNELALS